MISFRNKKAEAERIRNYYAALQQFAKNNRDRIIAQQNEAAAKEAVPEEVAVPEEEKKLSPFRAYLLKVKEQKRKQEQEQQQETAQIVDNAKPKLESKNDANKEISPFRAYLLKVKSKK